MLFLYFKLHVYWISTIAKQTRYGPKHEIRYLSRADPGFLDSGFKFCKGGGGGGDLLILPDTILTLNVQTKIHLEMSSAANNYLMLLIKDRV